MSRPFFLPACGMLATIFFVSSVDASVQGDLRQPATEYVSRRVPVSAPESLQTAIGAARNASDVAAALGTQGPRAVVVGPHHPWKRVATLPSISVIHDISFSSDKVGYAAAELGLIFKTTDGGYHWNVSLYTDPSEFWYGVQAVSANDIVITGFFDSSDPVTQAPVYRALAHWSHDAGATWSDQIVIQSGDLAFRGRFSDGVHGVVLGQNVHLADTPAFMTSNGGAFATDWSRVVTGTRAGSARSSVHLRMATCGRRASTIAIASISVRTGIVDHKSIRCSTEKHFSLMNSTAGLPRDRFRRRKRVGSARPTTAAHTGVPEHWMARGRFASCCSLTP